MRLVVNTCDKCKKEIPNDDTVWEVGITCEPVMYRSGYHVVAKQQKVEWCRKCVEDMRIMLPLHRVDQETKPVTIDDMIREIVAEVMANG